jgi:PhoH-like ATPase
MWIYLYISEVSVKKNYILDTNVLIHDPQSIFKFEDNNLYIPIYVLEELDKLKSELSLRGRNSREVCRVLDDLRCQGSLPNGVIIGEGKLFIYVPQERKVIKVALDSKSMDNAILQCAFEIKESYDLPAILVTMDVNLRIRAECIGIQTASYEFQSVDTSHMITGHTNMNVGMGDIDKLFGDGFIPPQEADEALFDNICILLKEPTGKTALGRYHAKQNRICPIRLPSDVMGIKPKNIEQKFALDLLIDDDINIVTLSGKAGVGKTLLAICVGLQKTLEGKYSRLLVSRPIMPLGKDIGYLKGDLDEKMRPWMQPIFDNLEFLMMQGGGKRKGLKYDDLFEQDIIRVEPLTYIRGRSLPGQFIIIDEAQNLTSHELKTIITRCGEGSKIVLTGDPDQIDSPYMDKGSCGLSVVIEKLHGHAIVGHLTLSKGERSELADLAASVM